MPPELASLSPDEIMAMTAYWRAHPDVFYEDVLGVKAWAMQVEILKAVFEHHEVTVASCHATGKSFNAARIAATFLMTHPGSIVITTAPTWRQVKDVIWRELNTAVGKARMPLGGRLHKVDWEFDSDWYAIGLSTTEPDKFQGYHADHVLVIVDEAAGIEEPIFEGVRAITTNENAHILYIGNPTALDGTFYSSFRNPLTKKFHISAFDTPNFTQNGIHNLDDLLAIFTPPAGVEALEHIATIKLPLPYPALISPRWVYERFIEWGTDSPMWQARVMGEFPSQAENTLIPLNLIEQAMDPDYRREHNWPVKDGGTTEYGVDVARFGSDRTVIAPKRGDYIDDLLTHSKLDTTATTDRIIATINPENPDVEIKVDDTGVGGGVTDQLNARKRRGNMERGWYYRVTAINFGSSAIDPDKFFNRRAEMYWALRDKFYAHQIALPNDWELANELASIRYSYTTKDNKIKIEGKDEVKKRVGKSPDKADAVVLACAPTGAGTFGTAGQVAPTFREPGVKYDEEVEPAAGLLGKQF